MTLYKKFLPGIVFLLTGLHGHADKGLFPDLRFADSLLPVSAGHMQKADIAPDLLEAEADYQRTRDDRKGLKRLLKVIKIKRLIPDSRRGYRLFTNLARFSARLKLYPLAMKFYNKAGEYRKNTLLSWYRAPAFARSEIAHADIEGDAAAEGTTLVDSATFSYMQNVDSLSSLAASPGVSSPPVEVCDLRESFDDGKTAISYALILHAKQPIPGKRRSFTHINNVGHTFITLIKYNSDNSFTARSFGFYPHKKNIFSATPLHIRAPSVFKDDALHDWDESIGKFISAARFERILDLLARYDHATYNLNRNNCTDFGLHVAALVGISIADTRGTWPLGRGNNPANAGQSMLEGKFRDTDGGDREPLFVCNNVPH
ncbi:hypothetical protein Q4E93_19715 [Flavitalea sp. BT771]|uniref:hypothetical protein n=1 Tax=Flavitalea sp. BT771 TaxID=3063329 RepID=UPI0026E40D3F|nr:hypothetical protein [Flavitalea sp. BT771]MDO6432845.1 hypothetical protein [Flavitalea sp. BT771]MDV6221879.1 hypothetical protein [Flavitalea sp. BT771]